MTKILILEANPRSDLQTSDEIRDIQDAIDQSRFANREQFEVRLQPSALSTDLQKLIQDYEPEIIHFCGHGTENDELQFRDKKISKEALIELFRLSQEHLRCVVLNSCFSEQQAKQVVEHIDFAIGMKQTIRDDAAIAFAIGFYQALGYGKSYELAFEFGCNAIQIAINDRTKNKDAVRQKIRKLIPLDNISEANNLSEHEKPTFFAKNNVEKLIQQNYCNLPNPEYSKFIGRESELEKLIYQISQRSRQHIAVIEGIGGVGKTALAVKAAHLCWQAKQKLADNDLNLEIPVFDTIIFTSAKKDYLTTQGILKKPIFEETLQEIFRTIAKVLNQPSIIMAQNQQEQLELAYEYLRKQSVLLVVDNLESINKNEQKKVVSFLADLPRPTKAIVTSREKLGFYRSIEILELSIDESLDLIEEEARNKEVKVTDNQAKRFHKTFGGIPIALIYAVGQRRRGYSVKRIIGLLDNKKLPDDLRRFLFERSVEPLRGQPAHKLLMSMTFFQSSPTRDALVAVSGLEEEPSGVEEGLAILQQLSLVSEESKRYSILPITHRYALDELAKHKDFLEAAQSRWIQWCIDFTLKYGGKDWDAWRTKYDYFAKEWENIASVLYWCAARDKYEEVKQIWQNIDRYVDLSCYWRTRRHWWSWLITRSRKRGDLPTYVRALSERAWTLILMGDDDAEIVLNEAWDMRENVDPNVQAHLANHFAVHRITKNKYNEALQWLEQQEKLVEQAEFEEEEYIRHKVCITYYRAEIAYWKWKKSNDKNEYSRAKKLFKEVSKKGQQIKWQRFTNYAQNWLADLAIADGISQKKEQLLQLVLFIIENRKKKKTRYYDLFYARSWFDYLNSINNSFLEAEKLLKSGLFVAISSKERRRIGHYNASYARLEEAKGNNRKAIEYANDALNIFDKEGISEDANEMRKILEKIGYSYAFNARLEEAKGNNEKTIEYANNALNIFSREDIHIDREVILEDAKKMRELLTRVGS